MSDVDWPQISIADLCISITDCVNRTAPVVDHVTPYRMLRTTNVKSGYININDVRYVTEETYKIWTRREIPRKGDVILTREAPLGEVGMLRGNETVFLGQRLVSYRPDPKKLDSRFLLYSLQADTLQSQIRSYGSGSTVEHMRVPDAKQLMVPLPPLATQHKIANILSAYDDLIENNQRRIAILEDLARNLYREWFVDFRFPGHEQAAFRETELGRVPEGWEELSIRDVSAYINRGVSPKYNDDSSSIVINQKCIRNRTLSLDPARKHASKVPSEKYIQFGDILINSTGVGTLGRVAQVYQKITDCTVDSHVSIVRPNQRVTKDYFGFFLTELESHFEKLGVGSTGQTELGRNNIADTPFLLPPLSIQQQFGELVAPMRQSMMILAQKNANLRRTRDLLLPRLVSGEIDVAELEVVGAAERV